MEQEAISSGRARIARVVSRRYEKPNVGTRPPTRSNLRRSYCWAMDKLAETASPLDPSDEGEEGDPANSPSGDEGTPKNLTFLVSATLSIFFVAKVLRVAEGDPVTATAIVHLSGPGEVAFGLA